MEKLNEKALANSGALLAAACMVLLSIGNYLGAYTSAASAMMQWHMFYSPTLVGTLTGALEAAVWTWVGLYFFGWLYNRLI